MKKGSFGIRLAYLAALAFIFAIVDQPLLCGLMMFIAIFVEKDEWLGRQTIQALLLCFVFRAVSWLFSSVVGIMPLDWGLFSSVFGGVIGVIEALFFLLVLVFGIIALINVLRDKEANVPILSSIAYKAYDKEPVQQRYVPQQPMQYQHPQPPVQYQQPPVGQQQVQQYQYQPVQTQQPVPPQAPVTQQTAVPPAQVNPPVVDTNQQNNL